MTNSTLTPTASVTVNRVGGTLPVGPALAATMRMTIRSTQDRDTEHETLRP